jgi:choice-of-anchor B domain-containing protein
MNLKGICLVAVLVTVGIDLLQVVQGGHQATLTAHGGHAGTGGGLSIPVTPLGPTPCVGGFAGPYPCARVDLAAFVPIDNIGGGRANDIWGWVDPGTQKEYAMVGRTTGTSFIDISDPGAPVYLGTLPPHTTSSTWRGIKVYANHAFIVSEAAGHGLQVFDLTQLRSADTPPVTFSETAHYGGFGNSHTVAVNEETGFLYAAGTNTCAGGLHIIDVRNPGAPAFAGCFSADGYTHETQCVRYVGPHAAYAGREICFNSNENTLTVVDVTNKSAPVMLARKTYVGRGYTHQGWLTPDHQYFLLDDEKDEANLKTNTRTHLWDVSLLTAPRVIGIHEGASTAIDHNLYIRGSHAFESNYRSGLRVLDTTRVASATLREIGFFDVHPEDDQPAYSGTWSNYPFFPSGVVVVSNIERGLFVLRPNLAPLISADLVVSKLSSPAVAGASLPLTVTHATENQGGANAPGTVTRLYLSHHPTHEVDDVLLEASDVTPLSINGRQEVNATVTIPADTASGIYYLIAVADDDSQAAEEIENNNIRPRYLRIGPDLTITLNTGPATVAAGSSINVTDTVTNSGGGSSAAVNMRLFLSTNSKLDTTDRELSVRVVPALGPNETNSATRGVTIPAGTAAGVYYLLARVDSDNEVSEVSETNNDKYRKITVQ